MNQLRVLTFTALLLILASPLFGQWKEDDFDAQLVVCNDGPIRFSVARAYRSLNFLSGYEWQMVGWYNIEPKKCEETGRVQHYFTGGGFRKDPVTLLAFAFYDSTGAWGAAKLLPLRDDRVFHASSTQFCVQRDGFAYVRDSPEGALPQGCDGAQAGYAPIPVAFEYKGPLNSWKKNGDGRDELHVTLNTNDRAVPLGLQSSSGSIGGTPSSRPSADTTPSICGAVSCWDQILQGLIQAGKEAEARKAAANANRNTPAPPPTRPQPAPAPVAPPKPAPPDDDPFSSGGFITRPSAPPLRPHPAPIMVGKVDVSHLAGLLRGDSQEYVTYFLGSPKPAPTQDGSGFGGDFYKRDDGLTLSAGIYQNGITQIKVYSKGSRDTDPLLNLLGKTEADAVALLGPPKTRESLWRKDNTDLVWSFPLPGGRRVDEHPEPDGTQTLTLHFKTGVGCESISIVW